MAGKFILKVDGTKVSEERGIDLVAGTNVTLTTTYTEAGHEAASVEIAATGASGAPSTVDYLVGTADAGLSAEIVVGTAPGGELGGTWASPTVDTTHAGSAHHTQSHAHSAAGDGTTLTPAVLNLPASATPAQTADGDAVWDSDDNLLTVGDGASRQTFLPVVDATSDPLAVSTAAADGTEATLARKDHVHAHEAAHINHDTTWAAQGDLIVASADDTAAVLAKGTAGTFLQAGASTLAYADVFIPVTFAFDGTVAVTTGAFRWYNDSGRALTVSAVRASVGTAPTGATLIVDVNEGGTTMYTTQANRPTIAISGNTTDATLPDDTSLADNGYLTVDIDQVGSTVAGADLVVTVWLKG